VQEWCSDKCQTQSNTYELFGIVLHSGISSGSGHYEAYVRIPHAKQEKDDEMLVDNNDVFCMDNRQTKDSKVENVNGDKASCNKADNKDVFESHSIAGDTTATTVGKSDGGISTACNHDKEPIVDKTCTSNVNSNKDETSRVPSISTDPLKDDATPSNTTCNDKDCSNVTQGLHHKHLSDSNDMVKDNDPAEMSNKNKNNKTTTDKKEHSDSNVDVNQNHVNDKQRAVDDEEQQKVSRRTLRPRKAKKSSVSQMQDTSGKSTEESELQPEEDSLADDKSPLNAKGKSSCIPLITKYFHRSKKQQHKTELKRTVKCDHSNADDSSSNKENVEVKIPLNKKFRTIEDSFKQTSSNKPPKSSTIRKLDFVRTAKDHKKEKAEHDMQEDDNDLKLTNTTNFYPEKLTKSWIHFDDCMVDNVTKKEIINVLSASESSYVSPYLLFYRKTESLHP